MRIRADHVTLGRVVLLPLPVAMLHGASPPWLVAALAGFTLLGLTDVIDGPLARRDGATRLGPLLDNICDRLFLAVVYCALAEFGIVPLPLLQAMLAREFFVVALRGLFHQDLRGWRGGQLKTTVQMFGAGFLLLLQALPGGPWFAWAAGGALAGSAALGLAVGLRRRRLDWRAAWGVFLSAGLLAAWIAGGPAAARAATLWVIGAVTFGSALRLVVRFRAAIRAAVAGRPARAFHVTATTCIVPLAWAPLLGRGPLPATLAIAIVAAELAILVLGNALAERGRAIRDAEEFPRLLALAIAGLGVGVVGFDSPAGLAASFLALAGLLAVLLARTRAIATTA